MESATGDADAVGRVSLSVKKRFNCVQVKPDGGLWL